MGWSTGARNETGPDGDPVLPRLQGGPHAHHDEVGGGRDRLGEPPLRGVQDRLSDRGRDPEPAPARRPRLNGRRSPAYVRGARITNSLPSGSATTPSVYETPGRWTVAASFTIDPPRRLISSQA